MKLQDTLQNLGFGVKETSIYLALLELGEATILEISRKAAVKRPTTYLILRSLEEKGLVSRIIRGKKTLFSAQHPEKLVTEAELRLKELKEIVPQLASLVHTSEGRPRVMIYEGKDTLDRAYDEAFLVRGEILLIDTHQLSYEIFLRTYKKFEYVTLSPEFKIRELVDESEAARAFAAKVREPFYGVRFMPKELSPFELDIGIFGNRVLISSVKKEYFTVGIESDEISRAFRTIFELMWRAAQE